MTMIFGIPLQALLGQLLIGLINGSFYALLSLGLAIIFGLLRVINFAQADIGAVAAVLALEPQIVAWSQAFTSKEHALFLGRGLHYPVALEGAERSRLM